MIDKKFIGNKIQTIRKKRGITQEELSEQVGISTNYLSKVERGLNSTSAENLLNIMQILNIKLEDFGIINNVSDDSKKQELIKIIANSNDSIVDYLFIVAENTNKFFNK